MTKDHRHEGTLPQVTYRKAKPVAAYLYLPRRPGDAAATSKPMEGDVVVDRTADGRPIGIEILSPTTLTAAALNKVLVDCGVPQIDGEELHPLHPAA